MVFILTCAIFTIKQHFIVKYLFTSMPARSSIPDRLRKWFQLKSNFSSPTFSPILQRNVYHPYYLFTIFYTSSIIITSTMTLSNFRLGKTQNLHPGGRRFGVFGVLNLTPPPVGGQKIPPKIKKKCVFRHFFCEKKSQTTYRGG